MPRTYERTVRQKPLAKYTDEQINSALMSKNSGMSYRDCSKKYGIPVAVLHRHKKFKELNPGKNMKPQGGQTILSKNVEKLIVESLITCSAWAYPLTTFDLRIIVKSYLDSKGTNIKKFKDNMPGVEFAMCFLRCHRNTLSQRLCQNIKRSRTQVSREDINDYFNNLEQSLNNIPPCNILNYDETNLSDDPGRIKVISKRGCKYPERVMNHSKSCTPVMFACTGDGELLPPYTVYKALHMYTPWITGGPKNSRYNRSKSGWFDSNCFEDWLLKIVIPYFKNMPGKKILIGDNLSSHLTITGIKACSKHNIKFVFLPPNSTHLTQPLDVSFFRPLKIAWRKILTTWKLGSGTNESAIPKSQFPTLLNLLMDDIKKNQISNIQSGFKKCGIIPINRENVLNCLPLETMENDSEDSTVLSTSLISILKEMRYTKGKNKTRQKRQRLDVQPGKSVEVLEMEDQQIFRSDEEEQMHMEEADNPEAIISDLEENDDSSVNSLKDAYESEKISVDTTLKNGKKLEGVYSYGKNLKLKENDWIVVDFSNYSESRQCSSKNVLFIGTVLEIKPSEVQASFVKYSPTKLNSGKNFVFPDPEDICWINKEDIIGVLNHPILQRRGQIMFAVNFNEW